MFLGNIFGCSLWKRWRGWVKGVLYRLVQLLHLWNLNNNSQAGQFVQGMYCFARHIRILIRDATDDKPFDANAIVDWSSVTIRLEWPQSTDRGPDWSWGKGGVASSGLSWQLWCELSVCGCVLVHGCHCTNTVANPDTMLLLCEVYAVFTLVTVTVFAWLGRSYDPRTWALVGFLPGLFAPWFVDTQGFAWQVVGAGKVKPSLIHWPLEDATVMVDIGSGNGLVPSGTAITWSNVDPDLQLSPFGITIDHNGLIYMHDWRTVPNT